MVYVKCEICDKILLAKDAGEHRKETGHNSWTLLWENREVNNDRTETSEREHN